MNRGLFEAQLNSVWDILKALGLDGDRVWCPTYPQGIAAEFRVLTYEETWRHCVQEQYYDFMLIDNSLLQFRFWRDASLRISYAFYECPYSGLNYPEFVAHTLDEEDASATLQQAGDIFREEYETYLTTCQLKATVTPIRYDLDPESYIEGLHPASHIHFGFNSDIRIGTRRVLKPLSFVLLILRQCYKNSWRNLLSMSKASSWCKNVREGLTRIDDSYFNSRDAYEMHLD